MNNDFRFNISLQILNHLGRNLYRNFITVLVKRFPTLGMQMLPM